ncbi:MAG: AAA family ATPase [Oscillospiraceae bacterium]|jgi:SpoVK/Ycf46/Vps4 family AAA+-type ATPase|nr:AAA family ATPase [Oscillospiraceae bacterium]
MTPDKKPDKSAKPLRPSGSYLDSLSDFAELLGTIGQAEKAAREMERELDGLAPKGAGKVNNPPGADDDASDMPRTQSAASGPAEEQKPTEEEKPPPGVDELLAELDALVGLHAIKESVRSLINLVRVRRLRGEAGLGVPPMSLHMVFTGNPGTGKTTVARIMGGLFRAIGVLSKGHLVETDRGGLVAGYVGQTAIKTGEVARSALGGILFIDEAYALAPPDASNDFGREAVETLLKLMEDHRDDFVVIVAGYDEPMSDFISSNPGLESRFNRYFAFPDYNAEELLAIFGGLCEKHEYTLSDEARKTAGAMLEGMYLLRGENFGNARDVRNLFENVVAVHADRVAAIEAPTREELVSVTAEDIEKAGGI